MATGPIEQAFVEILPRIPNDFAGRILREISGPLKQASAAASKAFDPLNKAADSALGELSSDAKSTANTLAHAFDDVAAQIAKDLDVEATGLEDLSNQARTEAAEVDRAFDGAGKKIGDDLEEGSRRGGSALGGLGKAAGLAAGAFAAIGGVRVLGGFIQDAEDARREAALTAQVLKTTGGVANVTADDVDKLSTALAKKAGVDDDSVTNSQRLLLTFTKIRNETGKNNDIFNQATEAALDMSAALGTDLQGASIQVGKALNDPTKGVTALSRAGVSFTQQQKDQIKTLQQSGDTLGAQKIILSELETQFGGAAEEGATTSGKLKAAFGEISESIGTALLPAFDAFGDLVIKALPAVQGAIEGIGPAFQKLGQFAAPVLDAIQGALSDFANSDTFNAIKDTISGLFDGGEGGASRFTGVLDVVSQAFSTLQGLADDLRPVVENLFSGLGDVIEAVLPVLGSVADTVLGTIVPAVQDLQEKIAANLVPIISQVVDIFRNDVVPVIETVAGFFTSTLIPAVERVAQTFIDNLGPIIDSVGKVLREDLVPAIADMADTFQKDVLPVVKRVAEFLVPIIEVALRIAGTILGKLIPVFVKLIGPILGGVLKVVGFVIKIVFKFIEVLIKVGTAIAERVLPIVKGLIDFFTGTVLPIIGTVADVIKTVLVGAFNTIADVINNVVVPVIRFMADVFTNVILPVAQVVGDIIKTVLVGAFNVLVDVFKTVVGVVQNVVVPIFNLVSKIFTTVVVPAIQRIIAFIRERLVPVFKTIAGFIRDEVIPRFQAFADKVRDVGGRIADFVGKAIDKFKNFRDKVKGFIDNVKGFFDGLVDKAKSLGSSIGDNIRSGLTTPINAVIDKINGLIGAFNKLPGPDIGKIQKLARGAIVDKETLAIIGEAGREVVVPLTRPARAVQLAQESGLFKVPGMAAAFAQAMPKTPPVKMTRISQPLGVRPVAPALTLVQPRERVVKQSTVNVNNTFALPPVGDPAQHAQMVASRLAQHLER